MPFHVICLETNEPIRILGDVVAFNDGREAAECARIHSDITGKKHQPRPIKVDANEWKQREQARFDTGHYQRLPWHDAPWFKDSPVALDHYAHVSTERDGMIAFTESPEKGAADRQTRQRPGTYLQRFFPDIGADKIQELARDFAGRFEDNALLLATTADEIERVYREGPNSCMTFKDHQRPEYSSPFHPCRVYASGDLAVAYVMRGGHIVGRALCWPERKQYSRVYGDADRLAPLLRDAGYKSGNLRGAKLVRHEHRGQLVCPYIDNVHNVDDCGDYLRIGGDLNAESTSGMIDIEESGEYCPSCEETADADSFYYMEDTGDSICESCADNAYQCARTGNRYARQRSVVRMANGDYWAVSEFENHGFTCEATDENYHHDESVHLHDGTVWCQEHFDSHGFQCRQCSECFENDEGVETMGGMYCEDCAPEPESGDESRPIERKHIARQGRDESPNQLEISLLPPQAFHVGDIVTLADNTRAQQITTWRSHNCGPGNQWGRGQTFQVSQYHVRNYNADTITLTNSETWEADAFILVSREESR